MEGMRLRILTVKWVCYYSSFTDERTEGRRGQGTCLRSQTRRQWSLRLRPNRRSGSWVPRRRARAPLLQEWSGFCDALAGGQRGDQFPFYLYPTSPGLAWRGPAHIRTQHTPWGTPPPVAETWSPPRLTERFRVFWKCHTRVWNPGFSLLWKGLIVTLEENNHRGSVFQKSWIFWEIPSHGPRRSLAWTSEAAETLVMAGIQAYFRHGFGLFGVNDFKAAWAKEFLMKLWNRVSPLL